MLQASLVLEGCWWKNRLSYGLDSDTNNNYYLTRPIPRDLNVNVGLITHSDLTDCCRIKSSRVA